MHPLQNRDFSALEPAWICRLAGGTEASSHRFLFVPCRPSPMEGQVATASNSQHFPVACNQSIPRLAATVCPRTCRGRQARGGEQSTALAICHRTDLDRYTPATSQPLAGMPEVHTHDTQIRTVTATPRPYATVLCPHSNQSLTFSALSGMHRGECRPGDWRLGSTGGGGEQWSLATHYSHLLSPPSLRFSATLPNFSLPQSSGTAPSTSPA